MVAPFNVQIETGPRRRERLPLSPGGLTIGRQVDNDLTLVDQQVSRHHAQLTVRDGVPSLTDLGTGNGTLVNGTRISGTVFLRPGDTIGIGATTLRLLTADAPLPHQPAPAAVNGRGPLLIGGVIALILLVCACGTAGLAVAVGDRASTPTPAVALDPSATLPTPVVASGLTPTSALASAPSSTAGITATLAPTATAQAQAPVAQPSGNAGGTYSGNVQRGYTITFRVSADGKEISDVQARVRTQCSNKRYGEDLEFLPPVSFPIAADGSFGGEGRYQAGGPIYRFSGQLSGGKASGTRQEESAGGGIICNTYRLEWTAERQAR